MLYVRVILNTPRKEEHEFVRINCCFLCTWCKKGESQKYNEPFSIEDGTFEIFNDEEKEEIPTK